MIKAAAIAALSIPVFCSAADVTADMQATISLADSACARFTQVSQELNELGVELPPPSPDYNCPDEEVTDEVKVMSELGMFFDAGQSHIVYLGNVRLLDRRLNISASEQLHLQLPGMEMNDNGQDAAPPSPDAPPATEKLAPPAAEEEPETEAPYSGPAASATADLALADTVGNMILIYSPSEGGEINLSYGGNKVHISSAGGCKAPRLLADAQGNILMEGAEIHVSLKGSKGDTSELHTCGGQVYYHAASRTLYAPGASTFTHPEGTLSCCDMLSITLLNTSPAPRKSSFMSQFTGLKFDGIETATVRGKVIATSKGRGNAPAASVRGDELTYNGQTGACSLTGTDCRLNYGDNRLQANEGIHLLPNGDIELRGSQISGNYTRQGSTPGTQLCGSFKANGHVIFRAGDGTVSTGKGIHMADEEMDFSCTGPVHLVLTPKADQLPDTGKPGMPNLAIARYRDISSARAEGQVCAHRYSPGTRQCIGELQAHIVETNLTTGETSITGAPGTELVAHYNGNRLAATPAEGETATMELKSNGDVRLNGARLSAVLLNEEGTTQAECHDYVMLVREENRLETGSATRLQTEKAILTTNGPLHACLVADETAPTAKGKFTGLRFNYTGIREARTDTGCTVQTEKGSMQCTGPVRLLMNTEQKGADKMLGHLQHATASGQVAVAGKDSRGRLFRASGDSLEVDNATGLKVLRGRQVILTDANNTHIASGKGAAIRIDAGNNASITGEKHSTHATNIKQQINTPKPRK